MKKKKLIQLIALVGALILLTVGYFILTSVTAEEESTEPAATNLTYNVASVDQTTVHKISYTVGAAEYAYTLKEDATGWLWDEDPSLPLNNLYFANIVTAFTGLTSNIRLTDITPTQLMDYGLGESAQKVSFTDIGGKRTYRLGSYNNYNGKLYFCEESNLTVVYMVDAAVTDSLIYLPYDMIRLPTLPTDITPAKIMSVTLTPPAGSAAEGAVYTYYVGGKAEDETDVWYGAIGATEETRLSAEDGKTLSNALSTLAFSEMVSYKADDLAAFGLTEPWTMTVDYKVTQGFENSETGAVTKVDVPASFTLLLGNVSDSGLCYATVEDSPLSCTLMYDIFPKLLSGELLKTE